MDPMVLTFLLFFLLVAILFTGLPIAFTLSGIAIIFVYFLWGPAGLLMLASIAYDVSTNFVVVAVPLFVFMAIILESSGMADDLYETIHNWLGAIPGGLASGTIVICAIFAAMAGTSAVATITMGLIALPAMMKRGYDRKMVVGGIACGGALGILIPPSVIAVIYCGLTGSSVGKLFMGGFVPGIMIAAIAILYISIRCIINPHMGPTVPKEERPDWGKKILSLRHILLPGILVSIVLGTIYSGIGTPTEAAGMGALGAVVVAGINRRLSWEILRTAGTRALSITSMVLFIMTGAIAFSGIYTAGGAADFIVRVVETTHLSPMITIWFMMLIFFILGMLVDPTGMLMICAPVFLPIVTKFGFDLIWFGILFLLQCEMAYLTPPFGFNLFYLKAIGPKDMPMEEIYISVIPYILIQAVVLTIFIFFPQIGMWLPNMVK
jgi:tripartite ATP-independent transporter DctM subunit